MREKMVDHSFVSTFLGECSTGLSLTWRQHSATIICTTDICSVCFCQRFLQRGKLQNVHNTRILYIIIMFLIVRPPQKHDIYIYQCFLCESRSTPRHEYQMFGFFENVSYIMFSFVKTISSFWMKHGGNDALGYILIFWHVSSENISYYILSDTIYQGPFSKFPILFFVSENVMIFEFRHFRFFEKCPLYMTSDIKKYWIFSDEIYQKMMI